MSYASRKDARSRVVTLRIPAELDSRIGREARRTKKTRSAVVRAALEAAFAGAATDDPAREARRQSLLASGRPSDADALAFAAAAADDGGWR